MQNHQFAVNYFLCCICSLFFHLSLFILPSLPISPSHTSFTLILFLLPSFLASLSPFFTPSQSLTFSPLPFPLISLISLISTISLFFSLPCSLSLPLSLYFSLSFTLSFCPYFFSLPLSLPPSPSISLLPSISPFVTHSLTLSSVSFSASVHSLDLRDPEGLAYDWVHKRLYFTDYNNRSVQAMGIDGQNRSFIAHAYRPRAIIVDPCYG